MIYNIMLVSDIQQSDLVIHIYVYIYIFVFLLIYFLIEG